MKQLSFFILLCSLLLTSCKKDEEDPVRNSSVFIDKDPTYQTTIEKVIAPGARGDSMIYKIDLNQDGLSDFSFYSYFNFSPAIYTSKFRIDALAENCFVLCDTNIISPTVLNINDELKRDLNWKSEKIMMQEMGSFRDSSIGVDYREGNWVNVQNKYIGLMITTQNEVSFGWAKISVPDGRINSFTLHETGYKILN